MLYSFSGVCRPNDYVDFEWECPAGDGGVLGSLVISPHVAPNFVILRFEQKRGDTVLDRLTTSEEVTLPAPKPPPATIGAITIGSGPYVPSPPPKVWTGGVDAESFHELCKDREVGWLIEEKDALFVRVTNTTGGMQLFKMGFRIGGEDPLHDARWWADETGKPVRPLTFAERSFRIGARVGSLVVVDGRAWDKFKL
jgi:hypothetical protein